MSNEEFSGHCEHFLSGDASFAGRSDQVDLENRLKCLSERRRT